MTQNPVTVEADASVQSAAQQMRDKAVGSLVALRDEKGVGLLTDQMLAPW